VRRPPRGGLLMPDTDREFWAAVQQDYRRAHAIAAAI
jgi:hypothetical protein